jgi:hypothetical protein
MFVKGVEWRMLVNSSSSGSAPTTVGGRYSLVGSDNTHFKGIADLSYFIVGYFGDSIDVK